MDPGVRCAQVRGWETAEGNSNRRGYRDLLELTTPKKDVLFPFFPQPHRAHGSLWEEAGLLLVTAFIFHQLSLLTGGRGSPAQESPGVLEESVDSWASRSYGIRALGRGS